MLLNPAAGHRREVMQFLVSHRGREAWTGSDEDNPGSERQFHQVLRNEASRGLGELLDAISVYEQFARILQDAFDDCLHEMSHPQRKVSPNELSRLASVKRAAQTIPQLFPEVRERLSPFEAVPRFEETFTGVAEPLAVSEWLERLLEHHRKVQLAKPPAGKAPWIDRFGDGSCMVRTGSLRDSAAHQNGKNVHAYRTASLWSFAKDLRLA
jgi:hypothetical protein